MRGGRWATLAAAALLTGCGGGDSDEAAPERDAVGKPLSAACTDYRRGVAALPLPPGSPAGYPSYMRRRLQLAERLNRRVRAVRTDGDDAGRRSRLLAASAEIVAVVNDTARTTDGATYFTSGLGQRQSQMQLVDGLLVRAAARARVDCDTGERPSAEVREFRREAAEVCERSGRARGVPRADRGLLEERVREHARLAVPAESTIARETLAAERALGRLPREALDGNRAVALAARASEGWARQGVRPCSDLLGLQA